MPVRSRRLGDTSVATAGSGSTYTAFTVPANRTAIVKDPRAWLSASSVGAIWLPVLVLLANGTTRFVMEFYGASAGHAMSPRTSEVVHDVREQWFVLHEGDALRLAQPAGCEIQTYWNGTLLDGDPA